MRSKFSGIRSGALVCVGLFVFGICTEAFAPRRAIGQGWWRTRYQSGGEDRSQFQPHNGGFYVYNPRTGYHQYRSSEPYNSDSQHSLDARSEVTHSGGSSTGQHGYDVNRTYRTYQNDRTLAEGRIRYQGKKENNYQHDGSSHSIERVDHEERAEAEENRKLAQFFTCSAAGVVEAKQAYAICKSRYLGGEFTSFQWGLYSGYYSANMRYASAIADGKQAQNYNDRLKYTMEALAAARSVVHYFNRMDREVGIHEPSRSQITNEINIVRQEFRRAGYDL